MPDPWSGPEDEPPEVVDPPEAGEEPNQPRPGAGAGPADLATLATLGITRLPTGQDVPPFGIHTLAIVGQVEGHIVLPPHNKTTKYEHVLPLLVAVETNPKIEGLLVVLNTVGGDVEAGLALAEMLASMEKPTVSLILGGGHSIGLPIALACDVSFVAPTATVTIHPIRMTGLVVGVPQTFEYLEKMQDRVIRFITEHSRISETRLRQLMFRTGELARDIGTVLVGKDAAQAGLIDEVGGLAQAMARLRAMIETRRAAGGRGAGGRRPGPARPEGVPVH